MTKGSETKNIVVKRTMRDNGRRLRIKQTQTKPSVNVVFPVSEPGFSVKSLKKLQSFLFIGDSAEIEK